MTPYDKRWAHSMQHNPDCLTTCVSLAARCHDRTLLGYPLLAIGALLFFQLTRVRFVFGPTKLNVAYKKGDSLEFVRGWAYNKIVNWEFYPSPKFPILAYYREIESYAGRGSIHFIPCVFDAQQMFQLFEKSAPKQSKSE